MSSLANVLHAELPERTRAGLPAAGGRRDMSDPVKFTLLVFAP